MELKGTIQSIQGFEERLIKCYPHKLTHDGSLPYEREGKEGEPQLIHNSPYYAKVYQLFPDEIKGLNLLWAERVNARFFYDERYGIGTYRISNKGVALLGNHIKDLMQMIEDVWIIPKHKMTAMQAKEFGATNVNGHK